MKENRTNCRKRTDSGKVLNSLRRHLNVFLLTGDKDYSWTSSVGDAARHTHLLQPPDAVLRSHTIRREPSVSACGART